MFYRYACPVCSEDLRNTLPVTRKTSWYKFTMRHTLACPHCGSKIDKRFAGFDAAFATGFFAMLASGGFLSVWHLVRVLLPMMLTILCLRFIAGIFMSVYVQVNPHD